MKLWNECTRDEQIERWQQAARVLTDMTPHQKKKHFNMSSFGDITECGTVGCAAGRCALDPWFKRRGFKAVWYKGTARNGDWMNTADMILLSEAFFGTEGHRDIFMDTTTRSVSRVVTEIRNYIRDLKDEARS